MFTALDLAAMLKSEAAAQHSAAFNAPRMSDADVHRAIGRMLDSLAGRIAFEVQQRQQAEALASAQLAARGGGMTPLIP
jgi:hypothetical protein